MLEVKAIRRALQLMVEDLQMLEGRISNVETEILSRSDTIEVESEEDMEDMDIICPPLDRDSQQTIQDKEGLQEWRRSREIELGDEYDG